MTTRQANLIVQRLLTTFCYAVDNTEQETNKAIKIPNLEFSLAGQKLSIVTPNCRADGLPGLNAKETWHL